MITMRFYQVNGWEDRSADLKYARHICIGVVARNTLRALQMVQELYPVARLDAVNDLGIVHLLDEQESSVTQPTEPTP